MHSAELGIWRAQCRVRYFTCTVQSCVFHLHSTEVFNVHSTELGILRAQCSVSYLTCTADIWLAQYIVRYLTCTVHSWAFGLHSTELGIWSARYRGRYLTCTVHSIWRTGSGLGIWRAQYTVRYLKHTWQSWVFHLRNTEIIVVVLLCTVQV